MTARTQAGRKAKGTRAERRAAESLREAGWFVVRAAGSHGLCDLVALWTPAVATTSERGFIPALVVQVKTGRGARAAERAKLRELALRLSVKVSVEVWTYRDRVAVPYVEVIQ